jgi:DNA (cytosine-5)-methyltransferase 1
MSVSVSPALDLPPRIDPYAADHLVAVGDYFAPSVRPNHAALWTPDYLPAKPNGLEFIDIFSGAGGSSLGMVAAGYTLKLAANHWERAIESHAANFRLAEHLCRDVNTYDMRKLPKTTVAWFSPICTEVSQAGGNANPDLARFQAQRALDLFDPDADDEPIPADSPGWEKTRATAYDVIRATEVWDYDAIIIENVPEFATRWKLFRWWVEGLRNLGKQIFVVCLNSAHAEGPDNPAAPQWRPRLYIIAIDKKIKVPEGAFDIRPWAWCFECEAPVQAVQTWRDTPQVRRLADIGKIGKYRQQYDYTCPRPVKHHSRIVEPFVRPVGSIINWDDPGTRIGERKIPLKKNTRKKIDLAMDMLCDGPVMLAANHGEHDGRTYRPYERPMSSCTTKAGEGVVIPPFIVNLRGGGSTWSPADEPAGAFTANGNHHGLVHMGPRLPVDDITWGDGHGLVIPYRSEKPKSTKTPAHTLATVESLGVLRPERGAVVDEMYYRTLRWREQLRGQRFPDEYEVVGKAWERTMQAGNAVSSNAAQLLGGLVAGVLCRA